MIIFFSFSHVFAGNRIPSFLWLNSIPLCICDTFYKSSCQCGVLGLFPFLELCIVKELTWEKRCLFDSVESFPVRPVMGLLDGMARLFLRNLHAVFRIACTNLQSFWLCRGFVFSITLPVAIIFCLFDHSQPCVFISITSFWHLLSFTVMGSFSHLNRHSKVSCQT